MKKSWLVLITITNLLLLVFLLWTLWKHPTARFSGDNITNLLGIIVSCISIVITVFFVILAINAYGKIRMIDKAKENADELTKKVSSAESIIEESRKDANNLAQMVSSAKRILDETKDHLHSIQERKDEVNNLLGEINDQYELNTTRISNISREMCELLTASIESAIIHAEKDKNKNLKNSSLLKLYRLSYKYPDSLDEKTRVSYILNLSVFGDKSDIDPLKRISKTENESAVIKNAAETVLEDLKEKYPE